MFVDFANINFFSLGRSDIVIRLLTEPYRDSRFYKHFAPNGAAALLHHAPIGATLRTPSTNACAAILASLSALNIASIELASRD
jgi:hypothetical protein